MRILIVNPNTTVSMTRRIEAAARAVAVAGAEITATNPAYGPPSIEGYYDEVFAIPGMIEEMRRAEAFDACIIACFDDTGLRPRVARSRRRSSASAKPPSIWRAWSPASSQW